MSESKELTTLSDAQYLQALEYRAHVQEMLASYDHPTGILLELISQMADAFWWIRIYCTEKNYLVVSEMTDCHHEWAFIRCEVQNILGRGSQNPDKGCLGRVFDCREARSAGGSCKGPGPHTSVTTDGSVLA